MYLRQQTLIGVCVSRLLVVLFAYRVVGFYSPLQS